MPHLIPYLFILIAVIATAAVGIHQGSVESSTVAAYAAGWVSLALLIPVLARWRIRVWRHRDPVRATSARIVDGAVKTFHSAKSRTFIVDIAASLKERHPQGGIPAPMLTAYRSDGIEHLQARWPKLAAGAATEAAATDTVLTFRVDPTFDDLEGVGRHFDGLDNHIPVGDMVDAVVLANLITDASRDLAPWNGSAVEPASDTHGQPQT